MIKTTELTAYPAFMKNIRPKHAIAPKSEMYHLDLNFGRYEGSAAKCCKKEIKHKLPYVTIKNMDITSATASNAPRRIKNEAMATVTMDAL
jgi:hypothetical protein